jgi:hypothetical protein
MVLTSPPPDRPSCCGTYLLMLRLPDRLLTIALRLPGLVYNVSISESLRSQTTGTSIRRTPQESRCLMSDTDP